MSNIITTNSNVEPTFEYGETKDYTNMGKCSCCGACCSVAFGISDNDIKRIKRHIEKHNIEPHTRNTTAENTIDFTCPFLDIAATEEPALCSIYDKRPEICKAFKCDMHPIDIVKSLSNSTKKSESVKPRNLAQIFYPDIYMPKPGDFVIPNHLFADDEAVTQRHIFVVEEEITPKTEKDPYVHIMKMHRYDMPHLKLECDIAAFVKILNVVTVEKEES